MAKVATIGSIAIICNHEGIPHCGWVDTLANPAFLARNSRFVACDPGITMDILYCTLNVLLHT